MQLSRRLVPSTTARVPRPRRLAPRQFGGPLFQVPQMPAAIFVALPLRPVWCRSLCNPSTPSQVQCSGLLSRCDGTRGGKRDKAAARKVSLLVCGWRGVAVIAQRCWLGWMRAQVKSCLNHVCHAVAPAQPNLRDKVSTTDRRYLARLPHVFGVSNVIFNISFFYSPSSLWLHASHGGNQTCLRVCRDEILKHAPLYARVSAWVGG